MGLFSRMGIMVRGFFGLFVGNMESKNPDALFEDIKNRIDKARKEAEHQIIEIQTSAELIKIEMKNAEKNLGIIRARVEAAQRQGEKDVLIEMLVHEEEFRDEYETNRATYDNAMAKVAKIKEEYKIFESEMSTKLSELKSLKSEAKMASLRENINSVNARYTSKNSTVGSVNESMERAREIVNRKTARANAVESLNDNNLELKIKRLDMNSARDRARVRAEAMLGCDKGFEVKEKAENKVYNS
jgi:phage shock protein A